jgi:hypothetical protein
MKNIIRFSSAFAAAFAGVAGVAGAATIFVAQSGNNTDGQSWATAYTSLADALGAAAEGDAIWVKQDTYSVAATLTWKNAVDVYGGFAGTETELSQRSSDASLTILDGGGAVRVLASEGDLTIETTWSGFTIQNGKVTPSNDDGGGGVKMHNNTILDNCIVQNNEMASGAGSNIAGGGILICPSNVTPADLDYPGAAIVRSCKIRGNKSQSTQGGGGIFIGPVQSYYHTNVYIQNSEIVNNYSKGQAGAIHSLLGPAGDARYYIENCVIANNYAETNNGGAVFVNHSANNDVGGGIFFYNCTVVNNKSGGKSYGSVGGIYINNNALAEVKNCVFWGNQIPDFDDVSGPIVHFKGAYEQVTLQNCAFDGQEHGTNAINNDQPLTVSSGTSEVKFKAPTSFTGNAVADETVAAYAQNAWALEQGSLLIDAGTVIPALTRDIINTPRHTDGSNPFDIGAYEYRVETAGGEEEGGKPNAVRKTGEATGIRIFSATAGSITVKSEKNLAAVAYVYDLTGSLVKVAPLTQGDNTIKVSSHRVYLVKVGEVVQKILVE